MNKPIILVLEDQQPRVDWLLSEVDGLACVRHVETVVDFYTVLTEVPAGEIALIILDHDLGDPDGTGLYSKDEHGADGREACRILPPGFLQNVPFLVWSSNDGGAPKTMVTTLRARGLVAEHVAFRKENKNWMLQIVLRALRDHASAVELRQVIDTRTLPREIPPREDRYADLMAAFGGAASERGE